MKRIAAQSRRALAGFTLVELLITMAIIIVLLTILVPVLTKATGAGQKARTEFLMTSISKALMQFKSEVGYLPPVLDMKRNLIYRNGAGSYRMPIPPTPANEPLMDEPFEDLVQDWYSYTTLAEYLIGYGDRTEDGHGVVGDPAAAASNSPGSREFPRLGIRHPGPDGVWGAATDPRAGFPALGLKDGRKLFPEGTAPADANLLVNRLNQGKIYGPYLELKDDRLLGGIQLNAGGDPMVDSSGEPIIVFAGEDPDFDTLPKVIVDYWGKPIRYYRAMYPHPQIKNSFRPAPANLGDVIVLRPSSFIAGADADTTSVNGSANVFADGSNDTSTSRLLQAAEVALFSGGADRTFNAGYRVDADDFNRDNIVEYGP